MGACIPSVDPAIRVALQTREKDTLALAEPELAGPLAIVVDLGQRDGSGGSGSSDLPDFTVS
jgi:hypothetical protein